VTTGAGAEMAIAAAPPFLRLLHMIITTTMRLVSTHRAPAPNEPHLCCHSYVRNEPGESEAADGAVGGVEVEGAVAAAADRCCAAAVDEQPRHSTSVPKRHVGPA